MAQDTAGKPRAWAAREAEKEKFMETIGAFNNDPVGTLAAMEKSG